MDESTPAPPSPGTWAQPAHPVGSSPVPPPPSAWPAPAPLSAPLPELSGYAMKRRGPVAVWLGLPLITLGIYHLVWYYKVHDEIRQYDQRQHSLSPFGSTLVLLLLGWTIVGPLISYYNTGEAIAKAQRAAGIPATCNPLACMLLYFVFGLNTWYMQKQLNLIVEAYPGTAPGVVVPLPATGQPAIAA
jgi:hypothetical protein